MKSTPRSASARESVTHCSTSHASDDGGIQSEPGMRTNRGIVSGIAARVKAVSSRRRRMRFSRGPEYGAGRLFVAAERVECRR